MSSPVRSSAQINYLVTAYATLHAHKTVAVTAETPQEAVQQAVAALRGDSDLQDGWTVMSELTIAPTINWDTQVTDGRTLPRPTALLNDATAEDLIAMLSEASDNHAARLFDLQPRDAVAEVAAWDRVVAFLRGNGISDVDLRFILANLPDAEQRDLLKARVDELDEAERDDASRAMLAFDLDDQAWDALPEAARTALLASAGNTALAALKAKADAYDRTAKAMQDYDAKMNAEEKAPEGDDYNELYGLLAPVPALNT
ncbi:hypothetical protein DOMOVOI_00290 [Brevundimonas phage vB_BpoS-Domovoi]|uniref:Uncharacterized protein n=1 Tax=Brevundimonas phage vB_BpoS-Domovoi TaxID=2948598 RepID=A0A9E7MQE6_9CAUD|nr:hypothetical protein DOMOVOI_00290 [Brevundimonas phage vB_BpoS-Domovoi]